MHISLKSQLSQTDWSPKRVTISPLLPCHLTSLYSAQPPMAPLSSTRWRSSRSPRMLSNFPIKRPSWHWFVITSMGLRSNFEVKCHGMCGSETYEMVGILVLSYYSWWCQNVHQWGTRSLRSNNRCLKIRKYREKPSKGGPVWSRPNTLRRLSQKTLLQL